MRSNVDHYVFFQLKQMTSFSFYSGIKNGGMASIIFGEFQIFFILYVMLQPSVKIDGVTERTTVV
jgi:hypothetical protein